MIKEQKNLDETIKRIEDQTYYIWELLDKKQQLIKSHSDSIGDTLSYKLGKSDQEKLKRAKAEPYFGRITMVEDGVSETFYIGKQGVRDKNEDIIVVDWRMPIASVYYNFMPGKSRQKYTVMDEKNRTKYSYEVDVQMKREYTIRDKKIIKFLQHAAESNSNLNVTMTEKGEELTVTDDFLRDIIENSETTGYLKEIIATIQKEQDQAIRQPLDYNVVIQGVAGSGKSSIALHRLSYLLFNNKHLKPSDLLILGPSELFISSFEGLLPDLNLEGIRQSTFHNLVYEHLKPFLPSKQKLSIKDYFEDVLFSSVTKKEKKITEFKGSEDFLRIIDIFLDQLQTQFEARFRNLTIFDEFLQVSDLVKIYEGYSYYPFIKRVQKFIQHVENHFKDVLERKINDLETQAVLTNNFLLNDGGLLDTEVKTVQEQIIRVREYKIKELKREHKSEITRWKKVMEIQNPYQIYKQLLSSDMLDMFKHELNDETLELFKGYSLKEVTYFDIAPIYYIFLSLFELPEKFAHIVIDEGQDLSYIHYTVLQKLTKTVTILGDKEQSIFLNYGQYNWENLMDRAFHNEEHVMLTLDTSYRSTKEIIEVANVVLANHYGEDHNPITPLNRSGPAVSFVEVSSGRNLLENLAQTINEWKTRYKRIAVIHKDEKKAISLAEYLKNQFNQDATYVNPDQEIKQGFVSVLASYYCKGMEFDAVIIVNANEDNFPKDELHARLMYVLLTRAQQEVKVFYQDSLSPLLEGIVQEKPKVSMEFDDIL